MPAIYLFFPHLTNVLTSTTAPPPTEHKERALYGAFFVFGGSYGLPHPTEHEKRDTWSHFSCLRPAATCPTRRIRPTCHHTSPTCSLPPLVSNTRTRPQGRVLVPLCPTLHLLPPRHEERDHRVVFFVSGWFSIPQTPFPLPSTTQT